MKQHELSLCLIHKDETDYLEEWLRFHAAFGVEHFYIYDNGSSVSPQAFLSDWIQAGWVTYHDIEGVRKQSAAYTHCLRAHGAETHWLGFIDTDEFLTLKQDLDLRDFLTGFEDFGGVTVNWSIFGSSGRLERPSEGQIDAYRLRTPYNLPENRFVKSIVQPEKTILPYSPHHFIYKAGHYAVNAHKLRVDNQEFPVWMDDIQLNHYWCRSWGEYQEKLRRGRADAGAVYDDERFRYYDAQATILDESIIALLGRRAGRPVGAGEALSTVRELTADYPPLGVRSSTTSPIKRIVESGEDVDRFTQLHVDIHHAEAEGDFNRAVDLFRTLADLYPQDIQLRLNLARMISRAGRVDEALAICQELAQTYPDRFLVLERYADLLATAKKFELAEEILRKAMEIDREGFAIRFKLSEVLLERKRHDDAFFVISQALAKGAFAFPDTFDTVKKLGTYWVANGRSDLAYELFSFSADLGAKDADLFANLARLELDRGNRKKCREWLEAALKIAPEDEELQGVYRRLFGGGLAADQDRPMRGG